MRWFVPGLTMVLLVSGCAYRPGTLHAVDPHGRVASVHRLGCLDVAVVPIVDSAAHGPVAGFRFANRCNSPVKVDLGAVQATGIFADGRTISMRVYDPDKQIRRGTLDARSRGREDLEYSVPAERAPPTRLCLDLSKLNATMHAAGPKVQVCIDAFANLTPTTLAWRQP